MRTQELITCAKAASWDSKRHRCNEMSLRHFGPLAGSLPYTAYIKLLMTQVMEKGEEGQRSTSWDEGGTPTAFFLTHALNFSRVVTTRLTSLLMIFQK